VHYPEDTGGGHSRYRLHQVGKTADGNGAYAGYGAPDLSDEEVARIADERAYARRFEAEPSEFTHCAGHPRLPAAITRGRAAAGWP